MNEENIEKLNDNATDIAEELIFRGGDRTGASEEFAEYVGREFDIELNDVEQVEDFLEYCQSSLEVAIFAWVQKQLNGNKENQ